MRLHDKVAVITGAAAGIGRETALLFANEGAKVVLTDLDEKQGNAVAAQITADGGQAIFVQQDVSQEESWLRVVETTQHHFGRIDILFNNAGIYIIAPITDITLETWNKLMAINVTSVFLGMKHVLPAMEKGGGGSVINASSTAGLKGGTGHTLYGASKGAVRIMTKDAAIEYAGKNIRINSIHPGYITTGMADYAATATHRSKTELDATYPMGRMGKPEEVAKLALFLASDESSYCTGAEFVIDGGATAK